MKSRSNKILCVMVSLSSVRFGLILPLVLAGTAAAGTIYVDAANCPGPGSGTIGDPFCSVQNGIVAAVDGVDDVEVAPGAYLEAIDFMGKAITVSSTGGAAVTIIDGGGVELHVVQCVNGEGPDTILDGFTITGGHASGAGDENGGGMYIANASSPTVRSCVFTANTATNTGGGLHLSTDSTVSVTGSDFDGNAANGGGGAFILGTATFTGTAFVGNTANFDGSAINSQGVNVGGLANVTLVNCLFRGNDGLASTGAAVTNLFGGTMTVTNCTFADNAGNTTGGLDTFDSTTTVVNCIFWDNTPAQLTNAGSGTTTVSYSDVQGGFPGTGNVDLDPVFVDQAGGDLRLRTCSTAADAGINSAVPGGVTTDLDGNPRFADDAGVADSGSGTPPLVDMGAYEQQVDSVASILNVPADFATIQAAIDANCDGGEVVVASGTYVEAINFNRKAITVWSAGGPDVTTLAGTGAFHVVMCVNGEGPDSVLDGFTITGGGAFGPGFLDQRGGGMLNDGASPTVTNCRFVGNSALILGGGMLNRSCSPTVTNCVFSGNSANGGGGMYNNLSNPTLANCSFIDNTAGFGGGGGMVNYNSSPTLTNSIFSGNSAAGFFPFVGIGGGMYNFSGSSPTLTNCIFSGNTSAASGGGMSIDSSSNPTLTNCTFSGNTAVDQGGALHVFGNGTTVTNCILWGNSPDQFDQPPTVTFSNVQGGAAGMGNIDADPLFVDADGADNTPGTDDDNLRLQPGSPCIDAGDNTAVPAGITVDLDGNPRFVDDPDTTDTGVGTPPIVDMGAYEFHGFPCPWDLDDSGDVGISDFLALLAAWGTDPGGAPDFDGDGDVGTVDFLELLANWGACP